MLFYYSCTKRVAVGKDTCSHRKYYRADKVESQVWDLISDIVKIQNSFATTSRG